MAGDRAGRRVPGEGEPASTRGLTATEEREAALAAARRFLPGVRAENIPSLAIGELRHNLARCRALLAAMVAAGGTQAPLVRRVDEAAEALRVSPATVYRLVNDVIFVRTGFRGGVYGSMTMHCGAISLTL